MLGNVSKQRTPIEYAFILLLFLAVLYAAYNTLSSFFGIFVFALIFSVSFSPLFEAFTRYLGGRRKLAAFIYAIVLLAIIALPFVYLINALGEYAHKTQVLVGQIRNHNVPPLPEWLGGLPYVGTKISAAWAALEKDPETTLSLYEPQLKAFLHRLLSAGGGILTTGLELIVGIIISAVLLYMGNRAYRPIQLFFTKLLGDTSGNALLDASGKAINGVAIGVMGTALIEAALGWIGFAIAGIPAASGLAAVMFMFAVVQLGPLPVQVPLIIWLVSKGENGWAVFMGIWLVVLIVVDNVIKPILIGKSGKLPILVLFFGVIGGMSAWGFTGMFKGAVMLALIYTMFRSWTYGPSAIADTDAEKAKTTIAEAT
jgi:predicted PurR-regulated permease PerM